MTWTKLTIISLGKGNKGRNRTHKSENTTRWLVRDWRNPPGADQADLIADLCINCVIIKGKLFRINLKGCLRIIIDLGTIVVPAGIVSTQMKILDVRHSAYVWCGQAIVVGFACLSWMCELTFIAIKKMSTEVITLCSRFAARWLLGRFYCKLIFAWTINKPAL